MLFLEPQQPVEFCDDLQYTVKFGEGLDDSVRYDKDQARIQPAVIPLLH